jgi:predicted SAM-dependent methyltransferase
MIPRELKVLFFILLSIPLQISGWFYRAFLAPKSGNRTLVRVQLGPGKRNYLDSWINVDANFISAKTDCVADFRRKLPFQDESVDAFYSINVIEHIPNLDFHFREMHRCLKPGGIIRVGGPCGDSCIRKFLDGDLEWFGVFPDRRSSVGGRLSNYLMMRGEHLHLLTSSYLNELSSMAGFTNMRVCRPVDESHYEELFSPAMSTERESSPWMPHSFLIEAVKVKVA